MCLVMTAFAAAVFAGISVLLKKQGRDGQSAFSVALCFASAALMWCVDSTASVAGGGKFFDMNRGDFVLGLIILASGCALYGILAVRKKLAAAKKTA